MIRYRWRIGLPLAHFAVDCIILVALFGWWHEGCGPKRSAILPDAPAIIRVQEEGPVFDPYSVPPNARLMLLAGGTLPAFVLSHFFRPHATYLDCQAPPDLVWFAFHSALALLCWYVIGRRIESGHRILGRVMLAYLAARLIFAVTGIYNFGARVQAYFWLGLLLILLGRSLTWTATRAVRLFRRA
jgi:hypothetical protein